MSDCKRFIYKVSWYKTKKHLNAWRNEYFPNEEQTRFIYEDPYILGEYDSGYINVSVIRVCESSKEFKLASRKNPVNYPFGAGKPR